MAVLQKPAEGMSKVFDTGEMPPEGTFVGTIIEIKDQFQVERKKFQSEEKEIVDVTTFLFGFRGQDGKPYKIASKTMKQSGHENSALYAFLKSILGRAPKFGWDYCELKGTQVSLTVEHAPSRDGTKSFPNIAAIAPLPAGYASRPPQSPPPVQKAPPPPPPAPEASFSAEDEVPF